MTIRAAALILGLLVAAPAAWAQPGQRPTQQQVEALMSTAVGPLRMCLARSLPGPPAPAVVVTLEFAAEGGFPMPMEIDAQPGSTLERCVGESLAGVNAPSFRGDALLAQCRLPLTGASRAACRPVPTAAPPAPRPPVRPPPPPTRVRVQAPPPPRAPVVRPRPNPPRPTPPPRRPVAPAPTPAPPPVAPPAPPTGPLVRGEVRAVMQELAPRVQQCGGPNPPPTVRLRLQLSGQGSASLIDTVPQPPEQIRSCIERAVGTVHFRQTGQRAFTVDYPIIFNR